MSRLVAIPSFGREAGASRPLTVFVLQSEKSGAPTFRRDTCALGRDSVSRSMDEIAQDLPADSRVGVEEPVEDGHGWKIAWWGGDAGTSAAKARHFFVVIAAL